MCHPSPEISQAHKINNLQACVEAGLVSINLQWFAMTRPCWTMSATGDWSRAARRSTAPLLCRGRLAGAHEGSHDPAIDSLTSSIALARDDAPTLSNQTVSK
jgi:hypothetical protein